MPFRIEETSLAEVKVINPTYFDDERGGFAELYKKSEFEAAGIRLEIKQVNFSRSAQGVLRGLHYQIKPRAQGKLIRVVAGEIFDVAVDLWNISSRRGRWTGINLSGENRKMLYIPPGFAHGFWVISETAEIVYYCDEEYAPELERGIKWDDKDLAIKWPGVKPLVSPKDQAWPSYAQAEVNL